MKELYWFTNDNGDNVLNDFYGTEDEAIIYAQKYAKILKEDIFINCHEEIVNVVLFA